MPLVTIVNEPPRAEWDKWLARPADTGESVREAVRTILADVRAQGDEAVRRYAQRFDGYAGPLVRVSEERLSASAGQVSPDLRAAMELAMGNIERFHAAQRSPIDVVETQPGIRCWRKPVPVESVGLYIPGGSAPLFSTLLMLGVPARLAGCKRIVLCSPPDRDGNLHPAILFGAHLLGIREVFAVGGVQAIGALAYGTAAIPAVDKIFGPGNAYVTAAKQLVQQQGVAIDLPAGPSELAVYADESCVAAYVAADLLSQCEHGPDSQGILVATTEAVARAVAAQLERQVTTLPREAIARRSLAASRLFILRAKDDALDLLNRYAPEHLILACREADAVADRVVNAGSVFLGNWSPESAGDYASGTNHTLPTSGYARAYSGVSLDSFVRKITFQELTREGLGRIAGAVVTMARAEGLEAHARAVTERIPDQIR